MDIIGRKTACEELRRCCYSYGSELVCVYGRRRVGKTYLVEQFFANDFAFHATGTYNAPRKDQLELFGTQLAQYGDPSHVAPKNWAEAFMRLERLLKSGKATRSGNGNLVVFLDEFPWFATQRSGFLGAFANFWNRCANGNPDLIVIICGSATSWIISNILQNGGDLYNRVTCSIFLEPFSFAETEKFFSQRHFDWSRKMIAECQMVFGGLPYFFERVNPNESLATNIDRLCLGPHALFAQETIMLLETTLRKSPIYEKILRELAQHRDGMRQVDLETTCGLPRSTLAPAIKKLCECGYIKQTQIPHVKGKQFLVQLIDPFILFHYKFIEPADRASKPYQRWLDFVAEGGKYLDWRGHAFEILVQAHIAELKNCINISDVRTKEYPWTSTQGQGGAQIDLVIEREDKVVNICEMKFTDDVFSLDSEYEQKLLNKQRVFKKESGLDWLVRTVLVCASGFKHNQHSGYIAKAVSLDDLFDASVS